MKCELQGTYGGDLTHALSAWTSTHRDLDPERKLRIPQLLSMLANPPGHEEETHGSPFEKSMLHFLIRVDDATHIHVLKHRIAVSVNGESARYKELDEPTCHIPPDWPEWAQDDLREWFSVAVAEYKQHLEELEPLLGRKRAKESARFFLPKCNEITLDVSFNFRSFMHFQSLRNHETAQFEVNLLAQTMLDLVRSTGEFEHSLAAFGY